MSVFDQFVQEIKNTEVMERVFNLLEREPAHLLGIICLEFESTGCALPDHRLQLNGFIEDISLKALVAAGLVYREDGGRLSLYQYGPTDRGLQQYRLLLDSGYYRKDMRKGKTTSL